MEATIHKRKMCNECEGKGKFYINDRWHGCQKCRGLGFVEVEIDLYDTLLDLLSVNRKTASELSKMVRILEEMSKRLTEIAQIQRERARRERYRR